MIWVNLASIALSLTGTVFAVAALWRSRKLNVIDTDRVDDDD